MKKFTAMIIVLVFVLSFSTTVFAATGPLPTTAYSNIGVIENVQAFSLPGSTTDKSNDKSLNVIILDKQDIAFVVPKTWDVQATTAQSIVIVRQNNTPYMLEVFQGAREDSKVVTVRNSDDDIIFMGSMNPRDMSSNGIMTAGDDGGQKVIDFCNSIQYIAGGK